MQLSFNKPRDRKPPRPLRVREPLRLPVARSKNSRGLGRWLRRLHALAGLVLSLNLVLLLASGFLVQHREAFGLEEKTVSRAWLPDSYRPLDGAEVRADIVVTDLHSGRVLGPKGTLIVDAATVGWFVLLISGLWIYVFGRRRNGTRNGS
jgi:hypothetical protein